MTETFEEFLEKEDKEWIDGRCGRCGEGTRIRIMPHYISVKGLGEWAWKKFRTRTSWFAWHIENAHRKNRAFFDYFNELTCFETSPNAFFFSYWEIAVGCLGKEEIEKRLKEAGK